MNREQRRRAARRRVGGLAGMSLVATTGLFGGYLGNPRVPRAYGAEPNPSCAAFQGLAGLITNESELRVAIDDVNAGSCDTIEIAAGTIPLTADLPVITSSVTITGNGQAETVIDGGGNAGLVVAGYFNDDRAESNPVISLADLTLTDFTAHDNRELGNGFGGTSRGGGLWAYYADATISNVAFTGNSAYYFADYSLPEPGEDHDGYGGAVAVIGGTLRVTESSFTGNEAAYGGAVYQGYASASMTITDSTFSGNSATETFSDGYDWGGGAVLALGSAEITGSTFAGNYAAGYGGAVVSTFGYEPDPPFNPLAPPPLTITDSIFDNNEAGAGYGGAVVAAGVARVTDSSFSANEAFDGGGAIFASGYMSDLTVSGSTFTANLGYGAGGGAIAAEGVLSVDYSSFVGNQAGEGDGGAITAGEAGSALIQRSTFDGNYANSDGGALYAASTEVTVRNSTFTANEASYGGAMRVTSALLDFVTVTANAAGGDGGGVYADGSLLDVRNSIIWGNTNGDGADDDVYAYDADAFDASYSIFTSDTSITTPTTAAGLLYDNPLLGGLADNGGPTRTMMPAATSPVVGTANASGAPATDQRGWARTTGGQADMGAVESRAVRPAPDLSQVPPSWFQATQRNAPDAPCPDGLDPSWAEWPNDHTGGWTCEQTTWWDVNKGTKGGWVTTPGFRSADKGRAIHHFRFRAPDRHRSATG